MSQRLEKFLLSARGDCCARTPGVTTRRIYSRTAFGHCDRYRRGRRLQLAEPNVQLPAAVNGERQRCDRYFFRPRSLFQR